MEELRSIAMQKYEELQNELERMRSILTEDKVQGYLQRLRLIKESIDRIPEFLERWKSIMTPEEFNKDFDKEFESFALTLPRYIEYADDMFSLLEQLMDIIKRHNIKDMRTLLGEINKNMVLCKKIEGVYYKCYKIKGSYRQRWRIIRDKKMIKNMENLWWISGELWPIYSKLGDFPFYSKRQYILNFLCYTNSEVGAFINHYCNRPSMRNHYD